MKADVVAITLRDLQEALDRYCQGAGFEGASEVVVESHGKVVITVELKPQGFVQAVEFKHRS